MSQTKWGQIQKHTKNYHSELNIVLPCWELRKISEVFNRPERKKLG